LQAARTARRTLLCARAGPCTPPRARCRVVCSSYATHRKREHARSCRVLPARHLCTLPFLSTLPSSTLLRPIWCRLRVHTCAVESMQQHTHARDMPAVSLQLPHPVSPCAACHSSRLAAGRLGIRLDMSHTLCTSLACLRRSAHALVLVCPCRTITPSLQEVCPAFNTSPSRPQHP